MFASGKRDLLKTTPPRLFLRYSPSTQSRFSRFAIDDKRSCGGSGQRFLFIIISMTLYAATASLGSVFR